MLAPPGHQTILLRYLRCQLRAPSNNAAPCDVFARSTPLRIAQAERPLLEANRHPSPKQEAFGNNSRIGPHGSGSEDSQRFRWYCSTLPVIFVCEDAAVKDSTSVGGRAPRLLESACSQVVAKGTDSRPYRSRKRRLQIRGALARDFGPSPGRPESVRRPSRQRTNSANLFGATASESRGMCTVLRMDVPMLVMRIEACGGELHNGGGAPCGIQAAILRNAGRWGRASLRLVRQRP